MISGNIVQTPVLKNTHLKSTYKTIFCLDRTTLKLIGKLVKNIEYNGKNCLEEIFVIKSLQTCLLRKGKPAIKVFGLGTNIQSYCRQSIGNFDPINEFPLLFQGLGLLKGNYHDGTH